MEDEFLPRLTEDGKHFAQSYIDRKKQAHNPEGERPPHPGARVLVLRETPSKEWEVFCPLRTEDRDTDPNTLDYSIGGHPKAIIERDGNTKTEGWWRQTAIKEAQEELSLVLTKDQLKPMDMFLDESPVQREVAVVFVAEIPFGTEISTDEVEIKSGSWIPLAKMLIIRKYFLTLFDQC
jgi:8-oxo-dGTP pyrophosphatase MutT (NUDIX family)